MECTYFKINISKIKDELHLTLIYRPLDKCVLQFCNDHTDYLEENILEMGELMLFGDFNIKINDEEDNDTINFLDFLDSFNIENINFLIYRLGNTLDLTMKQQCGQLITHPTQGWLFLDYNIALFNLCTDDPSIETVTITYRNMKDIDHTKFCYLLETTVTSSNPNNQSLNKCTKIYYEVLTAALDKFTPEKDKEDQKGK